MFKYEGKLYLLITDLGYARESRWKWFCRFYRNFDFLRSRIERMCRFEEIVQRYPGRRGSFALRVNALDKNELS